MAERGARDFLAGVGVGAGTVIGGIALLKWLWRKDKFRCSRCNNPVLKGTPVCSNCGQRFDWSDIEVEN